MPAVAAILANGSLTPDRLDAVACGAGPGSFTSLRIAASIAKGICAARAISLLAAPSTLLVAAALDSPAAGSYVVALDAMRGDFFCQDVIVTGDGALEPGESWRSSRDRLEEHAKSRGARIIGPAESPPTMPHAAGFARLMTFRLAHIVDLTSWEPNYGRKAEAQVRWETAHGRELGAG